MTSVLTQHALKRAYSAVVFASRLVVRLHSQHKRRLEALPRSI
jgi:hypothetical protein